MGAEAVERERVTTAVRNFCDLPLSLRRAPVSARYIDFGPGFVDEDRSRRIKPALTLPSLRPAFGHVGKVVLAGVQAFLWS
jgi:hypothetical protein